MPVNSSHLYTIINSRLLTAILLLNVLFLSFLSLTSSFPQKIGAIWELSDGELPESVESSSSPSFTEYPTVYEPSPEWLISALNDDNLPCENLPSPFSGQEHGYSYPPQGFPYDNLQSLYLPFEHQPSNPPKPRIYSDLNLSESCVDSAIADGDLCASFAGPVPKMDVVWTFANGSGVLHEKWRRVRAVQQQLQRAGTLAPRAMRAMASRRAISGTETKLFRDHDELRHSMRSVLKHFRPYTTQFHLITSDFAFPSCNPDAYPGWRLGQVPQWLDLSNPYGWVDGGVELSLVPHAKLFNKDYRYTTFNSLAIESQFAHLNVSDAFIYLNDDFYFTADLSPWDFYTPPYGLVLRMQPDLLVSSLVDGAQPSQGEWHSLEFSNRLLSDRFGLRKRPYVAHEAKALKRSLIAEISLIWSAELAATASHPFRTDPRLRDAHIGFMAAHFVVERWREGLLWSWVVARLGGREDEWDATTSAQAWQELGGDHETPGMRLLVNTPERDSLSEERLAKARASVPGALSRHNTRYSFTSQDGYPYTFLGDVGSSQWPRFPTPYMRCTIEFAQCFPSGLSSASEVFKHVAFGVPKCGDCIIQALIGTSGRLGLSAFLPPRAHSSHSSQETSHHPVPHLPLVPDYRTADFSLRAVLGDSITDVRSWTIHMLQRYRFVLGDTPSIFAMITNAFTASQPFDQMKSDPSISLLCLNDDIVGSQAKAADDILRREQEERWPNPAAWEKI